MENIFPNNLPDIKDMTLAECEAFVADMGSPRYRATQMFRWLHKQQARDFGEMTNIAQKFRQEIALRARISIVEIAHVLEASDGTRKLLFKLEDGNYVEGVLIPGRNHFTACLSTQVGCRMGCTFCLTGKMGFKRNLRPGEIVSQASALLHFHPDISCGNIVMMGMGEPLDNYDNIIAALKIITSEFGLSFSAQKITISTCGIIPQIARLGKAFPVNLAVSLNAANDEMRTKLMPINKKYPLKELLAVCKDYPMPARRMITFEYILIGGINDSLEDAKKLSSLLREIRCKINLIVWNAIPDFPFASPSQEKVEAFQKEMIRNKYTAIIRASKGSEIMAACGQLGRAKQQTMSLIEA